VIHDKVKGVTAKALLSGVLSRAYWASFVSEVPLVVGSEHNVDIYILAFGEISLDIHRHWTVECIEWIGIVVGGRETAC